ncbi:MAG: hypothetical protein RSE43_10760 [Oscillospiraceae bacterium]
MNNWMTIRSVAKRLKVESPCTMIGESTIRFLVLNGFPCVRIGSRTLVNADTFYNDLVLYTNRKHEERRQEYRTWKN